MTKKDTFPYSLGCLPDLPDNRDLLLGEYLIPQKLPPVIDWRNLAIPVKQQVGPSCVGFSSVAMKEIQEELEHTKVFDFNGLELYERCKKIDNISGGGTYIRVAMKILQNEGVPGADNKCYRIKSYTKLETMEEMKTALVATGPFVIGVDVYENFKTPDKDGVVPMPDGEKRGGHAILITGYNDNFKRFRFKNSWGSDWGQDGYAWLTYEFMEKFRHSAWAGVDADDPVAQIFINAKKLVKDVEKAKNSKKNKKEVKWLEKLKAKLKKLLRKRKGAK